MFRDRNASDLLRADEIRAISAGRRIGGTAEKRSSSSLTDPANWLIEALGGGRSESGALVGNSSASTIPVFNACVGILADMIGKLPCKLFRKTEGGAEEAREHPAHRLLTLAPGDLHTPFELRQLAQTSIGYGGNGYIRVWRDSFYQPGELQWLRPCDVRPDLVKRPDGRRFARFVVEGERESLSRADLIHIRTGTLDGLVGISPVRLLRESIGLSLTQREQAGKIFANGARFPGFLTSPNTLNPEQLKAISDKWQAAQAGTENAGKTPVLMGGMGYTAVNGMSMADAEFLDSRKFERSEIATLFRIPEVLLGNSDKASSWGTGIETLTNGFLQFALDPWLINWEQSLNYTLLTFEEQAGGYFFRFNRRALLAVALETQAKFLREMRDIGVYSPDDCRRFLDENNLPEGAGGDDYSKPFNGSGGRPASSPADQPAEPVAA